MNSVGKQVFIHKNHPVEKLSYDNNWGEGDCTRSTRSNSASSSLLLQMHVSSGCVRVACTKSASQQPVHGDCKVHHVTNVASAAALI